MEFLEIIILILVIAASSLSGLSKKRKKSIATTEKPPKEHNWWEEDDPWSAIGKRMDKTNGESQSMQELPDVIFSSSDLYDTKDRSLTGYQMRETQVLNVQHGIPKKDIPENSSPESEGVLDPGWKLNDYMESTEYLNIRDAVIYEAILKPKFKDYE